VGPLSHIRVLDLTIARAGPSAVRLLADWGADVIKIEPPPGAGQSVTGARRGPDEQNLHRNKRSVCVDLKHPDGHALFLELAAGADVVVENFKVDVKHRLKVDYETLQQVNERIIYASISGFGQDGPYADRGGVDQIVQGMSGLMSVTGEPGGGPMRVGVAISDTSAGMFLGQGILLALLHRERTGEGQWVHTSLLEAMMCKLDFQGARYTMNGEVPTQQGNDHPAYTPMGTFRASDGQVNIAASMPRLWERFCKALGAGDLLAHPDYQTTADRIARKDELKEAINAITGQRTAAELVSVLNEAGVPCGPINTIGEGFEDPQVRHLGMAKPAPHPQLGAVNLVRSPINLSRFPQDAEFRNAAPDPGTDTRAVLAELGLPASRIDALAAAGAIACTDPASA
jgi:crotonobetainyl-CoA:carnitine CoA-transferase CaiB-like acyl-CoA transferase